MDIPLDQFEFYIEEKILERGLKYCTSGLVQQPEDSFDGGYKFLVEGSNDYTVKFKLKDGVISDHLCTCPYNDGPVCKHVAAAIFYIQKDELGLKIRKRRKKQNTKKKSLTQEEQVEYIIKLIQEDELKDFVLAEVHRNKNFRDMFLSIFSKYSPIETKASYQTVLKSVIKSNTDRWGLKHNGEDNIANAIRGMIDSAKHQLGSGNIKAALAISTVVFENVLTTPVLIGEGELKIAALITDTVDLFERIAANNADERIRKNMLKFFTKIFDDDRIWQYDINMNILKSASFFAKNPEEIAQIDKMTFQNDRNEAKYRNVETLKYELMLDMVSEEQAEDYLEKNMDNKNVRFVAINRAIDKNDYQKAEKLTREGIKREIENNGRGLNEWYEILFNIGDLTNNNDMLIESTRFLFINSYEFIVEYYKELVDAVDPDKWEVFLKEVIGEIQKKKYVEIEFLPDLYVEEMDWESLFVEITKYAHKDLWNGYTNFFQLLNKYDEYLADNIGGRFFQMYVEFIKEFVLNSKKGKDYVKVREEIERMIMLGGEDEAMKLLDYLRVKFKGRKSLQYELSNVRYW